MPRRCWIWTLALAAWGCGRDAAVTPPGEGPMCTPVATTEKTCSGGVDDDCDGYVDCLDTECEGQTCGDGLTCSGGACRHPCAPGDATCVPELPPVQNVRVTTHGDTAIIEFEPVAGALDYR